jgi:predicted CoA-binding protein
MANLKQINEFLGADAFGLVGVSRNPKKFGYTAFKELKDKGMNVVPVNPFADKIYDSEVYHDVKSLPENVNGLIVMTKKSETPGVIREAKEKGFRQIWIQQMADSEAAINELEGSGINFVTGECILMHFKPTSIHKFHAALRKFFRLFPK